LCVEPGIDIVDDAINVFSMMAQEVQHNGTTTAIKGQCSGIFQFKCTIQDKGCKLIIDGCSFTNAISSELVAALCLSTQRLPMPRYM
jgi:hypothetical protein